MRIYQALDGSWVFNNEDGLKISGLTLQEAETMAGKVTLIQDMQALAAEQARLKDKAVALEKIYTDRGYSAGGSNPITDDDAIAAGTTAALVGTFVTFTQQLEKWLPGDFTAPTDDSLAALDHAQNLNKFRSDV